MKEVIKEYFRRVKFMRSQYYSWISCFRYANQQRKRDIKFSYKYMIKMEKRNKKLNDKETRRNTKAKNK